MTTEILIGNISTEAKEEDIRHLFEGTAGSVVSISVPLNVKTGKNMGYAYVIMFTELEAEQAITDLDGAAIEGRAISMSIVGTTPNKRKWFQFGR